MSITVPFLNELILRSEQSNAKVCSIVCDMGNTHLLSKLGVYSEQKHYFPNPADQNRRVYIIPDNPHSFKNMRNHTLDSFMIIKKSENLSVVLDKNMFVRLIEDDKKREFKLCPKLSDIHVNARGHERQRVKYATQLFSETVAGALEYLYRDEYSEQAKIISLCDSYFDVMNTKQMYDVKKNRCALGIHEEEQFEILNSMEELVSKMYFVTEKGNLSQKPFQKGITVAIKSVKDLYMEMKQEGWKYLITRRVNQDALENGFSTVRYVGGDNNHPTAANVCERIRLLCVSKNVKFVVENPSVEIEEETTNFISAEILECLAADFDEPAGKIILFTSIEICSIISNILVLSHQYQSSKTQYFQVKM